LAILGTINPHFKSDNGEIGHEGAPMQAWNSLPHAEFCKNCLSGYSSFGKIYTKN